jgi:hypothetical protein
MCGRTVLGSVLGARKPEGCGTPEELIVIPRETRTTNAMSIEKDLTKPDLFPDLVVSPLTPLPFPFLNANFW